jgi:hypothetical protein
MSINLAIYEKRVFSQNGEDGVTMKLLDLIYDNPNYKVYVEFGVQDGVECNTRILREKYGWIGLQMDGDNQDVKINLRKEFITKENVVPLFMKYRVPSLINLLSVDIDFNDFYCLKEILKYYKCDIIICEYNSTHLPHEDKVIIYDKNGGWDGSNYFGMSLLAIDKLAKMYNYSLIYCDEKGVNCFLVHNNIIKNRNLDFLNFGDIEKIYRPPRYGLGPDGGHRQDPKFRKYLTFEQAINV